MATIIGHMARAVLKVLKPAAYETLNSGDLSVIIRISFSMRNFQVLLIDCRQGAADECDNDASYALGKGQVRVVLEAKRGKNICIYLYIFNI